MNAGIISLDPSACASYDNLGSLMTWFISKQINDVTSNYKSLSNEILNTPLISIILESGLVL